MPYARRKESLVVDRQSPPRYAQSHLQIWSYYFSADVDAGAGVGVLLGVALDLPFVARRPWNYPSAWSGDQRGAYKVV